MEIEDERFSAHYSIACAAIYQRHVHTENISIIAVTTTCV